MNREVNQACYYRQPDQCCRLELVSSVVVVFVDAAAAAAVVVLIVV